MSEKINSWLSTHWKGKQSCPICQNITWALETEIFEFRKFSPRGGISLGLRRAVYPAILLTCQVCGHVIAFNAIIMGLVKRPDNKKNDKSQNEQENTDREAEETD